MVDLASAAASAALQVLFEKVLNALSTFTGYEYRLLLGGDSERVNQDLEKLMQTLQKFRDDELKIFKNKETREWYTTQNHLKKLLNGKKFLLVLDDVWNEDEGEWNKLKSPLSFGAPGSSILVTTRGSDVASIVRAHDQHKITVLSEDQCWFVFKESAFLEGNQENETLQVIGKQIAKKRGGLPLAAKSLGGSLRLMREVHEWESIRDSSIWELSQPCEILPALKLSLDSLKPYSRNCFTFCCVFPKGHKMIKEELIQLWMANDLIPSHLRSGLEDMGSKILNDLLLKSFFQVSSDDCDRVTMHDLMHDLGLSFGTECFCLQGSGVSKIPPQCQHLFIEPSYLSRANIFQTLSKSHTTLRTLLTGGELFSFKNTIPMNLDCSLASSNLTCLRALDLSGAKIEDLPISIGEIKNLKYLNLYGHNHLTHVPDSIGALTKLQTLKLGWCKSLTRLPDGITRLISLRHLDLSYCNRLTCLPDEIAGLNNLRHLDLRECYGLINLPDGIGRLVNLRYLYLGGCRGLTQVPDGIAELVNLVHLDISDMSSLIRLPNGMDKMINLHRLILYVFVVGRENGQRITELQGLNRLTRSLTIGGLEHVTDAREAEAALLKNKKNLSCLRLIWGDLHGSNNSSDEAESVLEALQPPQTLNEKLVIKGYGGSVFASWMRLFRNLVKIKLKDCIKCELLPPLGQLPLLECLTIAGMKSLKCISAEFYGRGRVFPSLKELLFEDMPILDEWQGREMDSQQTDPCPRLKRMTLRKCPKLTSLPSEILCFLQELEIQGCDKVIVRSLSCLTSLELNGVGTTSVTSFPATSLQNLNALESFDISSYDELSFLPDELCCNLISLKTLKIWSCPALLSMPVMRKKSFLQVFIHGSQTQKSTLVYLHVAFCCQLELSSEYFQNLISLRMLKLDSLPKLTSLTALQHLSKLEKLRIEACKNLIRLSPQVTQNLTVLEELSFIDCEGLELSSTDFQHLINLQKIQLHNLPKMTSIPDLQHLSTLQKLEITSCENLIRLSPQDTQNLTVLEELTFRDCEQLELSSTDFQHLINLQEIELHHLPKLTSIPDLQHLHSLNSLHIWGCENLKMLPQWLQNLTSLRTLTIEGCDHNLESRCAKDSGEYWPFIKHIPDVSIMESYPHLDWDDTDSEYFLLFAEMCKKIPRT